MTAPRGGNEAGVVSCRDGGARRIALLIYIPCRACICTIITQAFSSAQCWRNSRRPLGCPFVRLWVPRARASSRSKSQETSAGSALDGAGSRRVAWVSASSKHRDKWAASSAELRSPFAQRLILTSANGSSATASRCVAAKWVESSAGVS